MEVPFDEVAQEVERVDGLLFVLVERQPAEPVGEDLVDVYALWSEPYDLSDGGDAVLCGVDVLLGARVGHLDDSDQHGDGLCAEEPDKVIRCQLKKKAPMTTSPLKTPGRTCAERAVALSSILSHDADAVGGRLPNLGARVAQ